MRVLLVLLLSITFAPASATDELIVALQNRLEEDKPFGDIIDSIADLPVAEMKSFSADFEKGWSSLRSSYLTDFATHAESLFTGSARTERSKRVRELRGEFNRVRALGEGPMKEQLKEVSMPAIKELRELLMPSAETIVSKAPEALAKRRNLIHGLARFHDELGDVAVTTGHGDSEESLVAAEVEIARKYYDVDRKGISIMEKNKDIAEKADLPEAEVEGIRQLNEWRLLLDQSALVIDPKLSEAARGHSKDMEEQGFFAHESPVPGKKTPWDRAAAAGTSAGGENIFMGSESPNSANEGWFYSPGHHKNMFNPGFNRIGLGRHNRHWTQLLG